MPIINSRNIFLDALKYFLTWSSTFDSLPHVMVLSEIRIKQYEVSLYELKSFASYSNCNHGYRAGGILGENDKHCETNCVHFVTADVMHLMLTCQNRKINYCPLYSGLHFTYTKIYYMVVFWIYL